MLILESKILIIWHVGKVSNFLFENSSPTPHTRDFLKIFFNYNTTIKFFLVSLSSSYKYKKVFWKELSFAIFLLLWYKRVEKKWNPRTKNFQFFLISRFLPGKSTYSIDRVQLSYKRLWVCFVPLSINDHEGSFKYSFSFLKKCRKLFFVIKCRTWDDFTNL